MERKSDPRTCRLLHKAANLALCRMYNGVCEGTSMTMYDPEYESPHPHRGKNLYAGETLEQMLEKYFRLAVKAFSLDSATVDAFKAAMWYTQEGDNAQYFCHPAWQSVDAEMTAAQ